MKHFPAPSRSRSASRYDDHDPEEGGDLSPDVVDSLAAAGLTVGEPMGRDRPGRPAPRRAVDAAGRDVVVQVVPVGRGGRGARVLQRLADLRSVRHQGIVTVRDVIALPDECIGVVTDLVVGADLAVVLGARGGLTRSEAARLLDDVGSALANLHDRGAVHGDVSAANVVVRTDGRPVLVDVMGGVMEMGTEETAAPERRAGGPATPAADVYSLAALLHHCAGGSPALAECLERVLPDALDPDPRCRPAARDLTARVPEIAEPGAIEIPDGARLAAGALRATIARPTRSVPSRRDRPRRTSGRSRGRREPVVPRRRGAVRPLVGVLVVAAVAGGAVLVRDRVAVGAPARAAAEVSAAPYAEEKAGETKASPGAEPTDGDMLPVVVDLSMARDAALNAGDAEALAATTVPDSPAAAADASLMGALEEAGESVEGLDTMVSAVTPVDVGQETLAAWPGAVAVRVSQMQSPSVRVAADGTRRVVPAQVRHDVVLVLVPGPWRVAEVLPAE